MNLEMLNCSKITSIQKGSYFIIDSIEPTLMGKNVYSVYIKTDIYELIEIVLYGFHFSIKNIVLMERDEYLATIETGD